MAFQAPLVSLPSIFSTAGELWPSVSAAFQGPRQSPQRTVARHIPNRISMPTSRRHLSTGRYVGKTSIPEPLREVSIAQMRPGVAHSCFSAPTALGLLRSAPPQQTPTTASTSSLIFQTLIRPFSSSCIPQRTHIRPTSKFTINGSLHRRSFWGSSQQSGGSFGHLTHMEATANNNPRSATAQNAFYSALLRANRPDIVVQRFESGNFASNPACEALYLRAAERLSASTQNMSGGAVGSTAAQDAVQSEQHQAIAQAVASRYNGASVATTKGGTGAKISPLHVVVEETMGNTILRWIKFAFWGAFAIWVVYIVVTMLVESTGVFRRVGGQRQFEAKPELQKTRFSDVHGCEEAKEELQEIVDFLKAPDKFSTLGGKLPKGVLLVGPPGTGKTLLARAVAGEAGVPFFYMSGSEFDEVYVGVGAKRVRELFNAARTKAPAIVFIDELDAIGGKRNERDAAYAKQTLNQLLTDLDGFNQTSGVIFLAATNFPELLDKALTRPGRFDRHVAVPLPDVRGRVSIIKHYLKKMHLAPDVDSAIIARGTPGLSGAELENLANMAAIHASKRKAKRVEMRDFEWAKDKILMGSERRSAVIQQKDKVMTAYHEGGHALVALYTPHADPLYKATIMPRGHALGITFQLPEMDRVSIARQELFARMDVCMGGKVAEELVYGPDATTTGPSSDLQAATSVAFNMVTRWGFSEKLGNVDMGSQYDKLPQGTKQIIWDEVRRILEESKTRAEKLLTTRRKELDRLATALVEYETLNKEEIEKVVKGEKLPEMLKGAPDAPMKIPELPLPLDPPGPAPPGGLGVPGERPVDEPSPVPGGNDPQRPYPVS